MRWRERECRACQERLFAILGLVNGARVARVDLELQELVGD